MGRLTGLLERNNSGTSSEEYFEVDKPTQLMRLVDWIRSSRQHHECDYRQARGSRR